MRPDQRSLFGDKKALFKYVQESYNLSMSDVENLFHQVSLSSKDLLEYLKTGNRHLIWEPEDDAILESHFKEPNSPEFRYLVKMKG